MRARTPAPPGLSVPPIPHGKVDRKKVRPVWQWRGLLPLTVAGIFIIWFVCRGFGAGRAAYQSIASPRSSPGNISSNPTNRPFLSAASALHIGRQGAPLVKTSLEENGTQDHGATSGSNWCDDVELSVESLGGTASVVGGHALHENISVAGIVPIGHYNYYQVFQPGISLK